MEEIRVCVGWVLNDFQYFDSGVDFLEMGLSFGFTGKVLAMPGWSSAIDRA